MNKYNLQIYSLSFCIWSLSVIAFLIGFILLYANKLDNITIFLILMVVVTKCIIFSIFFNQYLDSRRTNGL